MSHTAVKESERLARERAFHDDRYADDTARADTGRFYRAAAPARRRYEDLVSGYAAGARVLEIGCGPGSRAVALAPGAGEVVGIDISTVALDASAREASRAGITNASFVEADAESTGLDPGGFDLVFGSGILHHLDLDRAAAEIDRLLDSEGRAVFLEPLGHNPLINRYRRRTPQMRTVDEHPLRREDLSMLTGRFGGSDIEFHTLASLAGALAEGRRGAETLTRWLHLVDARILGRRSPLRHHAWMVVLDLGR